MPATTRATRAARAQREKPFSFLQLPAELRRMVYDNLAKPTRVVHKVPQSLHGETPSITRTLVFTLGRRCDRRPFKERHGEFVAHITAVISLLSVSRQVYWELNAELQAQRVRHDFEIAPDHLARLNTSPSPRILDQLPLPSVWNLRMIVLPVQYLQTRQQLFDMCTNLLHWLGRMPQLETLDLSIMLPGELREDEMHYWRPNSLGINGSLSVAELIAIDALWERVIGTNTSYDDMDPYLRLPSSLRRFRLDVNGIRLLQQRKIVEAHQDGLQEAQVEWVDVPCGCLDRSQLCASCTWESRR